MNYKLTIGWLYPELMSTYGDRGNIMVLTKRCEWRKIDVEVVPIVFTTQNSELKTMDFIFGGGAQDRQQGLVIDDLRKHKGPELKILFEKGVPGLFVCGAPQLLGEYYMTGDGTKLEGLGIFDMVSKHFGKNQPRAIGNTVCTIDSRFKIHDLRNITKGSPDLDSGQLQQTVVGFENHGGRTYLGKNCAPFAKVLVGNGNNGDDHTEGAIYNNCIATYSHGPFLPKNPHIADWLIQKSLEVKYKKEIHLDTLDDELEWGAHEYIVKRFTPSQS